MTHKFAIGQTLRVISNPDEYHLFEVGSLVKVIKADEIDPDTYYSVYEVVQPSRFAGEELNQWLFEDDLEPA